MTSAKERMTSAEELYGRWLDELWAGAPVANELVSDDFVGHWPDRDVHGPDELSEIVEETRSMLADLRFDVEGEPLVEGDILAARWISTGAMRDGPKLFTGSDMFKVADGRFIEYWTGLSED